MDNVDQLWNDFLKHKVSLWYAHNERCHRACFTLTEFLGMSPEEYRQWVVDDVVSERVRRVWQRTFDSWKDRLDG
jgi:hypothetical protein